MKLCVMSFPDLSDSPQSYIFPRFPGFVPSHVFAFLDADPTLIQHCFNVLCLPGSHYTYEPLAYLVKSCLGKSDGIRHAWGGPNPSKASFGNWPGQAVSKT